MKVPYLPKEEIESAAHCLLWQYGEKFGVVDRPPIPVDEVLECQLDLHLGFDDLRLRLAVPDALGATWVEDRRVVIDQSLDPAEHPRKEGRYRFTVGHEVGHWELHRHLCRQRAGQSLLFKEMREPSIVCRTRSARSRPEWQANAFSAFLLMPSRMVVQAWRRRRGDTLPYVADREITELSKRRRLGDREEPTVEIARDIASEFHVSGQAMQIRLRSLGLICTEATAGLLC